MANFNWTFVNVDGVVAVNSISASNFVSASTFHGDGSGLTGVTGEWDGSLNGDAVITGSLNVTVDITGSSLKTATTVIDSTHISSSLNISGSAFYGDGSNLTNLPAGTPAGSDAQIQFNDGGSFGASSDLTWDDTNFQVTGNISGSGNLQIGGILTGSSIVPNTTLTHDLGSTSLEWSRLYVEEVIGDLEGAIRFDAINDEGASISKGQVVYIKGVSGQTPTVALAACDDSNKMPAFGLASSDATQGSNVQVVTFGSIQSINLASLYGQTFSEGDTVFVQTGSGGTSGSLTPTAPTGSGNLLQNIGRIIRNGGGGDGQIKVGGAGRSNATPNLDKGFIFIGNETNQSIQDDTVFVSSSANKVGINNTSPTHTLTVGGQISASLGVTGSSLETATTVINNTHISSSLNISGANFYGNGAQLTGMSPITNYNTVGDNRVITSVDSSTIAGEANLTFDGSKLSAVGQISASLGVTGSSLHTLATVVDNTHISSSLNISGSAFYGDGSNLSGIINSYTNSGNNRILTSVDSTSINSEANLTFDGTDLNIASSTASRPRVYIENQNDDANPSQLIFHKTSSSPAIDDIIGRIAYQSYDTAGNATIYGQIEGQIKKPDSGGERGRIKFFVAEQPAGTLLEALTLQGSDTDGRVDVIVKNGDLTLIDDSKIYFGTNEDSLIEYNENGDDLLVISGSATGTVISGSKLILDTITVTSGAIAGPGSYLGVTTTGQVVLTASAAGGGSTSPGGSDTQVQYNNGGSFGGVASLTFNDSTGDLTVIDDKKLFFGTNSDASIEYDENGSDKLIISGAHGGIHVSGSGGLTVAVNDGLTVTSATDDNPTIIIENTSDGIGGGALNFKRTTTDEAANDIIGNINFMAKDSAGNEHIYAAIQGLIDDPTSGGEEGRLIFKVAEFDGNQQEGLRIEGQASNGIVDVRVSNGSLQLKDLGAAGTTPASGFGGLYVNGDNLYFIDDGGTSTQLNGSSGGSSTAYNSFTANFNVTTDHDVIGIVTTGSAITASLAAASTYTAGHRFIFKDVSGSCSGSTNHIVISASQNHTGDTIDGAGIVKIEKAYGSIILTTDGVKSFYIAGAN